MCYNFVINLENSSLLEDKCPKTCNSHMVNGSTSVVLVIVTTSTFSASHGKMTTAPSGTIPLNL